MRPEKEKMQSPFRMTRQPAANPNPFPMGQHRAEENKFVSPTPSQGQILQPVYTNFMGGESFAASFQVHAHIYSPTVRYRQYVKGYFKYGDNFQTQALATGNMDLAIFLEDANSNGSYGGDAYQIGRSVYTNVAGVAGRAGYRLFRAWDTPSDNLGCPQGTVVEINLTFKGVLCEKNAPGTVYVERLWHVRGTLTRP